MKTLWILPNHIESRARLDWIDYAKGICIILVVMMHTTLSVEDALGREGLFRAIVEFARPFRIPAFFLIAGLFLARTIEDPWPKYLVSKVVHFAYFYLLWLGISVLLKSGSAGPGAVLAAFAFGLIEPFGALWFIYLLPIFYVVTKLLRRWPVALWCVAAALSATGVHTDWTTIDEFASRFVFFVSGFMFAKSVFAIADWSAHNPVRALAGLAVWASASAATLTLAREMYIEHVPGLSLATGFAGAAAVVTAAALMAHSRWLNAVRYCGRNSLPIFLAFFIPMAVGRTAIIRLYPEMDATLATALVLTTAITGPLILQRIVADGRLAWLFKRPELRVPRPA